ncbi:hypothetical protein CHF27_005600, partial [Romboutsia maritimum]
LLDNADLTDVNNYDRMMAFTNAAQQRVEAMESNEYVDDVYRLVKEVHQGSEVALRMIYDIDSLKTTFDNKAADKEKDARIDALNEAVIYARENNVTNNATINSATKLLHNYSKQLKVADVTSKENKQEYNQELVYAIEEMRIAIDLLDNADLTDVNNYDRMMAFTNAAQQRVEAMESNEYVDDVYRLVKEVHQGSEVALRMIYDIDSLKTTFDNKAADKEKDARIDALNEAVIYARENNVTNNATMNSATKLLHQYANLMK